jgi:hypothetical protein
MFKDLPIVPSIQRAVDKKKALWRIEMKQLSPEELQRKLDSLS